MESWNPNAVLPEHLQRDDHGGQVKPWVPGRREQDRILRAADPDGGSAGGDSGRAHRKIMHLR